MEKKKVMMVGPLPPTVGGLTTFMLGVMNSSLKVKYDFIPYDTSRPVKKTFSKNSGNMTLFDAGIARAFTGVLVTLWHIAKFPFALIASRPNLVHVQTPSYLAFWENAVYIVISRTLGFKTILHIQGGEFKLFYDNSGIFKHAIKYAVNKADVVIVLSEFWKKLLSEFVDEGKIRVLNNPVDTTSFRLEKKRGDNILRILFLGCYWKRKGIYDIMKAIPEVVKENKKVLFTLAGESDIEEFKRICSEAGVEKYVRFAGVVEGKEKVEELVNSDIFILPSYNEGMPLAILEAMAAGLPVVASNVGSIPEVIEENVNGFLITPGDWKTLADKILALAGSKELRMRMGDNNRKKTIQYDLNTIAAKLDSIYKEVAA
ncbi:MAG: glycosyltransferase family 4 protein [Candidatus Altiarchaeales archaeon]|nr:glycosyltransferase family 4 protein [Candidatus Altiarchaeales archaeon]